MRISVRRMATIGVSPLKMRTAEAYKARSICNKFLKFDRIQYFAIDHGHHGVPRPTKFENFDPKTMRTRTADDIRQYSVQLQTLYHQIRKWKKKTKKKSIQIDANQWSPVVVVICVKRKLGWMNDEWRLLHIWWVYALRFVVQSMPALATRTAHSQLRNDGKLLALCNQWAVAGFTLFCFVFSMRFSRCHWRYETMCGQYTSTSHSRVSIWRMMKPHAHTTSKPSSSSSSSLSMAVLTAELMY